MQLLLGEHLWNDYRICLNAKFKLKVVKEIDKEATDRPFVPSRKDTERQS